MRRELSTRHPLSDICIRKHRYRIESGTEGEGSMESSARLKDTKLLVLKATVSSQVRARRASRAPVHFLPGSHGHLSLSSVKRWKQLSFLTQHKRKSSYRTNAKVHYDALLVIK